MYLNFVKRFFDIFFVLASLIFLIPLFLILSFLVGIFLGRPVIFTQIRPGKNCKPFKIYKFRTMTNEVSKDGKMLPNEMRMTRFGNFLRYSSLDEIPEFYNVLKGDMTLVGPRPLLMDYLLLYNDFQNRRHEVKPGITGWAQVKGRNTISWDEKFNLDVWYVDNLSFCLDVKVLFTTLLKTIKREGITHKGNVTMPRFKGNGKGEKLLEF
jgi:lipopolysaccharide/colanic/teichoic acid biosynthesis glycosyltransferase